MRRRDVAKALALSAGPALVPREAAAQACAQACYPRTDAENGVNIANYAYASGPMIDCRRYGLTAGTSSSLGAQNRLAIQTAINVASQSGRSSRASPITAPIISSSAIMAGAWSSPACLVRRCRLQLCSMVGNNIRQPTARPWVTGSGLMESFICKAISQEQLPGSRLLYCLQGICLRC